MELVVEPDIYMPSIDELGNYVDKIPSCKKGLTCPCGSRKDKVYERPLCFQISSFTSSNKQKEDEKVRPS